MKLLQPEMAKNLSAGEELNFFAPILRLFGLQNENLKTNKALMQDMFANQLAVDIGKT